jgi:hypothetical protein
VDARRKAGHDELNGDIGFEGQYNGREDRSAGQAICMFSLCSGRRRTSVGEGGNPPSRHCEERSDEAIQFLLLVFWIASSQVLLAMTIITWEATP